MSDGVNFSARISRLRKHKADVHFAKHDVTQTKFVENVIDNIAQVQKALDCVCETTATTKKRK